MIICLIALIYILLVLYVWGFFCQKLFHKAIGVSDTNISDHIFWGYLVVTIYAEIFCIFCRVSVEADLILLMLTTVLFFIGRRDISASFMRIVGGFKRSARDKIVTITILLMVVIVVILAASPVAYGSSGDMGFYHAQTVHWIASYGATPGLANLYMRAGFCYANYCIDALFGFDFLDISPLRLIGIIPPFVLNAKIVKDTLKRKMNIYMSLFSLLVVCCTIIQILEFDNYSSEIASNYISFFAIYKIFDSIKIEKNKKYKLWLNYCILLYFAATVKLVIAPICIISIYVIYRLLESKNIKPLIFFGMAVLVIFVPWCIWSVITSGYVVFPYTAFDVLTFDWKVPQIAVQQFKTVTGLIMKRQYAATSEIPALKEWLIGFFPFLWNPIGFNKYFFRLIAVDIVLSGVTEIVLILCKICRMITQRDTVDKLWKNIDVQCLRSLLWISLLSYFFTAPDPRYFCNVLLPLVALNSGYIAEYVFHIRSTSFKGWFLGACILLLAPSIRGSFTMMKNVPMGMGTYIVYPGYLVEVFEDDPLSISSRGYVLVNGKYKYKGIDGLKIYYNVSDNAIFYDPFPGVPRVGYLNNNYGIRARARGSSYAQGFYGEMID